MSVRVPYCWGVGGGYDDPVVVDCDSDPAAKTREHLSDARASSDERMNAVVRPTEEEEGEPLLHGGWPAASLAAR
jgi:hypothetical protein